MRRRAYREQNRERLNATRNAYRKRRVEHVRKVQKAWREKNPDRWLFLRRTAYLRKYGLTVKAYEALLELQGGKCAACLRIHARKLHVDHDHETGAIRGLLCVHCNVALGQLEDNPARVLALLKYITSYHETAGLPQPSALGPSA